MARQHRFCHCDQTWRRRVLTPSHLLPLLATLLLILSSVGDSQIVQPSDSSITSGNVSPSQIPRPSYQSPPLSNGLSQFNKQQCTEANREWLTRYTVSGIPPSLSTLIDPKMFPVCRPSGLASCCTPQTEAQMVHLSRRKLHNILADWLNRPRFLMGNESIGLTYYFKSDINRAMNSLHEMFSATYGYNYKQNREFFVAFFTDLQGYMAGTQENITGRIDTFFDQLRERIVRIMENAKTSDDMERSRCISRLLKNQKPFEEFPETIKTRILRSYPQARTFVNALGVAGEILSLLSNQSLVSDECVRAHVLMKDCHYCLGVSRARPCQGLCTNVFNGCFLQYGYLAQTWVKFTDALTRVVSKLESPFNFPNVNHPLKLQISSAIMSLQSLMTKSKTKLEKECGRSGGIPTLQGGGGGMPPNFGAGSQLLGRQRRQAAPEILDWQVSRQASGVPLGRAPLPAKAMNPRSGYINERPKDKLAPWAQKMKATYQNFRNLFNDMASQICLDPINRYQPLTASPCWNGSAMGSNAHPVVSSEPANQSQNPLFPRVSTQMSATIKLAMSRLNLMTEHLLRTLKDQEAPYLPPINSNWNRLIQSPFSPKPMPNKDKGSVDSGSTDQDGSLPSGSGSGPILPPAVFPPPGNKLPAEPWQKTPGPPTVPKLPSLVDMGGGSGTGEAEELPSQPQQPQWPNKKKNDGVIKPDYILPPIEGSGDGNVLEPPPPRLPGKQPTDDEDIPPLIEGSGINPQVPLTIFPPGGAGSGAQPLPDDTNSRLGSGVGPPDITKPIVKPLPPVVKKPQEPPQPKSPDRNIWGDNIPPSIWIPADPNNLGPDYDVRTQAPQTGQRTTPRGTGVRSTFASYGLSIVAVLLCVIYNTN